MVIMHDFDLSRTTNGSGMIFTKTLSELKALSASTHYTGEGSYPGAKIPTLNEVLELVAGKGKKNQYRIESGKLSVSENRRTDYRDGL
jgi:glycerophosphoryl diester phosphodiesterase